MKKALIFIIAFFALALYYLSTREIPQLLNTTKKTKTAPVLPQPILNKVRSSQKQVLNKIFKNTKHEKAVEFLLDSEVTSDFYLDKAELKGKEAEEFLKKGFKTVVACIHDGCNEEPDEEGYYDPANTVAVSVMIRILEVSSINQESLGTSEWMKKEELASLLKSKSPKLRKMTLKKIFELYPKEGFEAVVDNLSGLEGYEAADTVDELIKHVTPENKDSFLYQTKELIKDGSPFTASEVLERLEKMRLTQQELEDISIDLCPYSREKKYKEVFKSMKYSVKVISKGNGYNLNLSSFCR